MRTRIALVITCITALFLFTSPVIAAPSAQTTLSDFTLNSQTTISVTVALTTGQVIVIPLEVTYIVQHEDGATDIAVIAEADQQAGLFIGIAPSNTTTATLQLPGAATADAATTSAPATEENVAGTHVANRNSNRRAGPGTNYAIVGRVASGGRVVVVGQNQDGSWLQLEDGSWVAEFLLDPVVNEVQEEPQEQAEEEEANNTEAEEAGAENETEEASAEDQPVADATPADLAAYLGEVVALGAQVTGAVNSLRDLFDNPQPTNPQWRLDVRDQINVLSASLDQYLDLTPVPGYEDLHTQVVDVASTCEQAVDFLAGGLQNPNSIDLAAATQSVQACAAEATSLAGEIETLQ